MVYRGKGRRRDSLCENIERRENRGNFERVTKAKREIELIEEHKAKLDRLDSRAHLRKGRAEQKLEEERAHTLSLECWGFLI